LNQPKAAVLSRLVCFEEQRNRLVGAFEAGRSAMKEEMGKGRNEG